MIKRREDQEEGRSRIEGNANRRASRFKEVKSRSSEDQEKMGSKSGK